MPNNYVEIKVKASDTAKPELTDLKLKLDELGHKVETARVDVDDADAEVKVLRLNAKLADLNAKVANPRIKVAGAARAEAEIKAVELELDRLDEKARELDVRASSSGRGGLLGRLLFGAAADAESAAGGGGGGGLAGALPGGASLPVVAAAIPVIGGLAVELTGVVSGFAAAGAGAGAFGILAMPAIKSVSGALTQIKADQSAYDRALTATAKNNALKHLKEDYAKLDPAQRAAVKGLQGLSATFGKMSKAFEPEAFKVFNDGLSIANHLLPALAPMAHAFAGALDGLLKQFDKFVQSKGFQDWLKQFTKDIGPAVTSIGQGVGKVAIAIGKLLTIMSAKDVARSIAIAFDVLAWTINTLAGGIHRFMQNYDSFTSTVKRDSHDIASSFDSVRHTVASWGHDIAHDFDSVRHTIASWVDDVARFLGRVVSFFRGLPGRIRGALGNLGHLLWDAGVAIVQGLLNGLASKFDQVRHTIASWGADIKSWFSSALGIFSPSKVFEQHGKMIAAGLIQGMDGSHGLVAAAAARLAGATLPGGYPVARAGAGAGGAAVIQLAPVPGGSGLDALFWTWLRNGVRAQGGDPSMFNRKVQFQGA